MSVIAVTFSVYHILYITGLLGALRIFYAISQHLAIHLGLILALIYLSVRISKRAGQKLPWYDVILIVIAVGWNLYILINFNALRARGLMASLETWEVIGSWVNMLIVLEAARRIMDWVVPGIAEFLLLYVLFADYFPGFLHAAGQDWIRVGRAVGLFQTGLYGTLLNISATTLFSFILFAQFLITTGAGDWFIRLAQAMVGQWRGGSAKVSVISSSLFGTISGSSTANVVVDGVITIPLMVRSGYRPHFAAAVEAATSNGGQIMPPVMGIAAFIMVDFLGMPYSRIVLAAILPAIAYYVALYLMVDFEAATIGLRGIPRSELPDPKKTAMAGWQYIIPLCVLIYFLLVRGYSAELSALYALAALVLMGVFSKQNRLTLRKIYLALKDTALAMMMIAVTLAVAGIIVSCTDLSGLSYRLSMGLVNTAGGNVWLLLVLTAICCIILGMGMTTSAVYTMMAILVAPALVTVGFTPLAAHFYVFYFGVSAMVTPPVCPTSFVAAGIIGAPPMKTGITASRLCIVCFLAPFVFIFDPALLMEGTTVSILLSFVRLLIATLAAVAALTGYMFWTINYWWRLLFLASTIAIIYPSVLSQIGGSAMVVAFMLVRFVISRLSVKAEVKGELDTPAAG